MSSKRFTWNAESIEDLLNVLINKHEEFIKFKKYGKSNNFYEKISTSLNIGCDGNVIESFIKNMGREFREVNVKSNVSGAESDTPKLRGSAKIYQLFETFQHIYFPRGSNVKPAVLFTEKGCMSSSEYGNLDNAESSSLQSVKRDKENGKNVQKKMSCETIGNDGDKTSKRMKSNPCSEQLLYLSLLENQNKLIEDQNKLMNTQNSILNGIMNQLAILTEAYCASNNLQICKNSTEQSSSDDVVVEDITDNLQNEY